MKSSYPVSDAKGGQVRYMDFHLEVTRQHPFHPMKWCQRTPAKAEDLNKIQSLVTFKVSRLQLKTTHHTKNQEDPKLNDKRQLKMLMPR